MSGGEAFIEFNSPHHLHGSVGLEKELRCETSCALKCKFCKDYLVLSCEKHKLSELSELPDDGDCTETCRSCFNVNFKIVFKTVHLCISW
jgi:hypothetical protein